MNTAKPNTTPDAFSWLRFPLAAMVVFIHAYGAKPSAASMANPGSAGWWYEFLRIFCSLEVVSVAVPLFFLISGYFFFYNMPRWSWRSYGNKLRRRLRSLLLPYLLWNLLFLLHTTWPFLSQSLFGHAPWSLYFQHLNDMGGLHLFWDSHVFPSGASGPILSPLWFLRDLIVMVLLTPLLYFLVRRLRWVVPALFALLAALKVGIPIPGLDFRPLLWFTLGITFSLYGRNMAVTLRPAFWPSLGVAACSLAALMYFRMGQIPCIEAVRILYTASASLCIIVAIHTLLRRGKLRSHPWLDQASFSLYLTHIFFLTPVTRLLRHVIPSVSYPLLTLRYLLVPILTILFCLALHLLWQQRKRLFPHSKIQTTKILNR